MATKTPPFAPYPAWSEAKFFGFLRSALRQASSRWPPKYEVYKEAKRVYKGPNKKQKFEWLCNECKKCYPGKEVSVDHVIPAGTLKTFEDLPTFVKRLFCGKEGLQVLCSTCHAKKTLNERRQNGKDADGS